MFMSFAVVKMKSYISGIPITYAVDFLNITKG